MYTILNLGWGVQSFTMAGMVAVGELPGIDAAIHADTLHESSATYAFAKKWTTWLEERGVKVITVQNPMGGIWNVLQKPGQTHVPLFTVNKRGKNGQLNRSCTHRWKIVPIRRYIKKHRNKQPVEQWIGISLDEFQRMKPSGVQYITHCWPLIEKKMTRQDCINWLLAHDLEVPQKSACVFCPYRSTAEWRKVKAIPKDWEQAVKVDRAIRNVRPNYQCFLHPSRMPLEQVDFRTEQERGQLSLWDDECSGICGI